MTPALSPTPNQMVLNVDDPAMDLPRSARAGIRGLVLSGLVVVTGFVAGAIYWAASSRLDGAVVAPASLVVEGNRRTVEHLDGGIVQKIHVANGDLVEAGQTLLELDRTELGLDLDVIESQLGDLTTHRARLIAQLGGHARFTMEDVRESLPIPLEGPVWRGAYQTQKRLFEAEIRTRAAEDALEAQQIANLEDQISGLLAQRDYNARQLDITRTELGNLETLLEKGLVAIARVNGRRVEVERLNGIDASLQTQAAQARNRISELRLTRVEEQTRREAEASAELAEVEASLAALEPQYLAARERLNRVAITAPVSGRVVEMTVFTTGGVVRPGAPILDIVPLDEPLVVEARVNTADVEKLFVGQTTRVRLSAFDQGDTPEATGRIIDISADRLEDSRTGQFHFVTRVALDAAQSAEVAALDLVPGMPADLFVNTGERTALSYFTQPIRDRLARTFIE